jgi:hypothetical protein
MEKNMNNLKLGLKDFFKAVKNEKPRLRYSFREFRRELRYAWRRAWFGYDDVDMFDCFEMFRRRMIRILEDFIKYGTSLLNLPKQSEHYEELLKKFPEEYFDEEGTQMIYQTMIFHLQMMNDDYVEKVLYGKNIDDDDYEIGCRSMEEYKRISLVIRQNKDAFMKLFSLFYFDLWD